MISRRTALNTAIAAGLVAASPPANAMLSGRQRHTLNAAYVGLTTSNRTAFETFLGRRLDGCQTGSGNVSIADYTSSIQFSLRSPQVGFDGAYKPLLLTMSMFCEPGNGYGNESLANVASGACSYDTLWATNAAFILSTRSDPVIHVRFGEEFNSNFSNKAWRCVVPGDPATTAANFASFVLCYQRMVSVYRANDPTGRFRFCWCPTWSLPGQPWNSDCYLGYPGDAYVDVWGMDVYYSVSGSGMNADPTTAFNTLRDASRGLAWLETTAAAHGKPTCYWEWGITQLSNGATSFITLMASWFRSHAPLFHGFWDQVGASYQISNGQYPLDGAAYIAAFGP